MFKENENKRIALAWERFRRIYRANNKRIGGLTGYILMDTLFEYAYNLTTKDTTITGDHFTVEISKIELAKNIGKTDASLRAKNKEGKTIYNLLEEEIGLKIEDGNNKYFYIQEGKEITVNSKVSTFYIPLHIEKDVDLIKELSNIQAEKENEKKILEIAEKEKKGKKVKKPSFSEGFRVDSYYTGLYGEAAYTHILNLEQQIKNNGERLHFTEINWNLENVNNYKLHKNLPYEVKQIRTAYTYFCLLAKNGVDPATDFDKHFKEIYSIVDRNAKGDIHAVHKCLMHLYNNYNYIAPEDILKALRKYLSPKQPIEKEESKLDNFHLEHKKLIDKINENPENELQIIKDTIKKIHNDKFTTTFYDYLTKRLKELENQQKELSIIETEVNELFQSNLNDELLA